MWPAVQRALTHHGGSRDAKCVLTARSIVAGLIIGSIVCCSNMYFGLQTGWISMQSLQSAMLGFGVFAAMHRLLGTKPLSVAENVIVQTTSVATATMPLAAGQYYATRRDTPPCTLNTGLVGVVPALGMLTPDENPGGPVHLSIAQLLLWSVALAFFGACFAPPLRQQTIVREQLPFPSGSATAYVIRTMHGVPAAQSKVDSSRDVYVTAYDSIQQHTTAYDMSKT